MEAVKRLWGQAFPDDRAWNAPDEIIARKRQVQPDLLLVAEQDAEIVGDSTVGV
jgi:hypothetical protein